ncbi:tyrosine-type recombinase/integrase, partial [Actinomycetota bacterium]
TAASYDAIVRNHLMPDPLAAKPLREVTATDVNLLLERVASKPGRSGATLSRKTVKNVLMVLKAALDAAVRQQCIPRSVVDQVDRPRPRKPEVQVWTSDNVSSFFRYVDANSQRMGALYRLAAVTGMRRGELAGLKWRHVDLEAATLRVERTRLYADGAIYEEQPKTDGSRRTIHIGRVGLDALRAARRIQEEDALALGDDWVDSGLVFASADGTGLHPDFISKRFNRDVAASGVVKIKFHGLRHTFATNALAQGENPKQVSEILGHSTIQTTLGLYSQFLPGSHQRTIRTVESTLFPEAVETENRS